MIEAPDELQKTLTIPEDHLEACRAQGLPVAGNAAGNTVDLLDMSGVNRSPKPLPGGFQARGVVALVFSCAVAFLGMAVISWYVLSLSLSIFLGFERWSEANWLWGDRYGVGEIGKKQPVGAVPEEVKIEKD